MEIVSAIALVLGVELNNPSISEDGLEYMMKQAPVYSHSTATNPVLVILAVICFGWCLLHIRKRSIGSKYSICSMALFIVFCGVVRWEPYVNRYMLPYLALLCPMVGYQLQEMELWDKKHIGKGFVPITYFLCFMTLFSLILYHYGKLPEKGTERSTGYFVNDEGMYPEYAWVFSTLKEDGCQTMGLKVSAINFEYPMWKFSKYTALRIENVLVENASAQYEDMSFIPDCVIMDRGVAPEEIMVHGQKYCIPEKFQNNERIAVFYKK